METKMTKTSDLIDAMKRHKRFKTDLEFAKWLDVSHNTVSGWRTRNATRQVVKQISKVGKTMEVEHLIANAIAIGNNGTAIHNDYRAYQNADLEVAKLVDVALRLTAGDDKKRGELLDVLKDFNKKMLDN